MLSKEEEQTLYSALVSLRAYREEGIEWAGNYTINNVLWLAEKIKELNNELIVTRKVYKELSDSFTSLENDYNILYTRLGCPRRTSIEELTKPNES